MNIEDGFLRVILAALAGAAIGLERESHGRAAGLRTTMLVCVTAAAAMLLSEHICRAEDFAGLSWRPDPGRVAAGILTGMGFLGGGTILREGNLIRGVTTAAVLWFVTVLGLILGSGQLLLGAVVWALAMAVLLVLPRVERVVKRDWYSTLTVMVGMDGVSDEQIRREIELLGVVVRRAGLDYLLETKRKVLRLELRHKQKNMFELSEKIVHSLMKQAGVQELRWD